MVVLDDADLDVAVNAALNSGFFSTGQRCTASSRLIVTEGIHDRFIAAMAKKMKALKVDDARKKGTDIGPVVDDKQLAQNLQYVAVATAEGAPSWWRAARRSTEMATARARLPHAFRPIR